jgi:hypothetical protein
MTRDTLASQKHLLTTEIWTRDLRYRGLDLRPLDQPGIAIRPVIMIPTCRPFTVAWYVVLSTTCNSTYLSNLRSTKNNRFQFRTRLSFVLFLGTVPKGKPFPLRPLSDAGLILLNWNTYLRLYLHYVHNYKNK